MRNIYQVVELATNSATDPRRAVWNRVYFSMEAAVGAIEQERFGRWQQDNEGVPAEQVLATPALLVWNEDRIRSKAHDEVYLSEWAVVKAEVPNTA